MALPAHLLLVGLGGRPGSGRCSPTPGGCGVGDRVADCPCARRPHLGRVVAARSGTSIAAHVASTGQRSRWASAKPAITAAAGRQTRRGEACASGRRGWCWSTVTSTTRSGGDALDSRQARHRQHRRRYANESARRGRRWHPSRACPPWSRNVSASWNARTVSCDARTRSLKAASAFFMPEPNPDSSWIPWVTRGGSNAKTP